MYTNIISLLKDICTEQRAISPRTPEATIILATEKLPAKDEKGEKLEPSLSSLTTIE